MAEVAPGAVAPVVPVVPAADTAPEVESTADQTTEVPEGDDKPEPPAEKLLTQSEVNKLVAKEKAKESRKTERAIRAEVERDYLQKQLEARDRPQQPAQSAGAPDQKDFKDFESWQDAKVAWLVEQGIAQRLAKQETETKAQREHREALGKAELLRSSLASARDKYDDFDEVINGDVPFTEPMTAFIARSKQGGELAYQLGTTLHAEAVRISKLDGVDQILAMKDLEAKLTAPPATTKTPAPIVPNRGNTVGLKPLLETNQDEFEARRKAFIDKKRARR